MNTTPDIRQAGDGVPRHVRDRGFVQVHRRWCDELIVELRLADVPGAVIGERLAEVETHCIEAGESPSEAFGDAVDYAREIAGDPEGPGPREVWIAAALSVGQVLALLIGTSAVPRWAQGLPWEYNVVQLICILLAGGALVALPVALRPIIRRPWTAGMPYSVGFSALAMGAALAGRLDLPALLVLPAAAVVVGMFVVVASLSVPAFLNLRSGDPLTSPLDGASRPGAGRASWATGLGVALLLPVAYLLLSVFSWLAA